MAYRGDGLTRMNKNYFLLLLKFKFNKRNPFIQKEKI